MDFQKEYIVQVFNTAVNNLRLRSGELEIAALLRRHLLSSTDIEYDILAMKKVTEFSKLAVKLGEVYNFTRTEKVNFLGLSDKFKEHCHKMLEPINDFLETNNSQTINNLLSKMRDGLESRPEPGASPLQPEEYEKKAIAQIREMNEFLDKYKLGKITEFRLNDRIKEINEIKQLTVKAGYVVIPEIYDIVRSALTRMERAGQPERESLIEEIRGCFIVAVGVIRNKDVNITDYLKKAEKFARSIL